MARWLRGFEGERIVDLMMLLSLHCTRLNATR